MDDTREQKATIYVRNEQGEFVPLEIDENEPDLGMDTLVFGWVVLAVIKLLHISDIPWGWVFAPIWLPVMANFAAKTIMFVVYIVIGFFHGLRRIE